MRFRQRNDFERRGSAEENIGWHIRTGSCISIFPKLPLFFSGVSSDVCCFSVSCAKTMLMAAPDVCGVVGVP